MMTLFNQLSLAEITLISTMLPFTTNPLPFTLSTFADHTDLESLCQDSRAYSVWHRVCTISSVSLSCNDDKTTLPPEYAMLNKLGIFWICPGINACQDSRWKCSVHLCMLCICSGFEVNRGILFDTNYPVWYLYFDDLSIQSTQFLNVLHHHTLNMTDLLWIDQSDWFVIDTLSQRNILFTRSAVVILFAPYQLNLAAKVSIFQRCPYVMRLWW